jgi:hypothetical protein
MSHLAQRFKINKKHYTKCTDIVRDVVGSYEKISQRVNSETGEHISAGTIRNWFIEQRIPVEYAALFSEFTEGQVGVTDFFPWIGLYV